MSQKLKLILKGLSFLYISNHYQLYKLEYLHIGSDKVAMNFLVIPFFFGIVLRFNNDFNSIINYIRIK